MPSNLRWAVKSEIIFINYYNQHKKSIIEISATHTVSFLQFLLTNLLQNNNLEPIVFASLYT